MVEHDTTIKGCQLSGIVNVPDPDGKPVGLVVGNDKQVRFVPDS